MDLCGPTLAEREELRALDHKVRISGLDLLKDQEKSQQFALIHKKRNEIMSLLQVQNS